MPRRRTGRRPPLPPSGLPTDIFPTLEEITSRAHALFVADGRQVIRIAEYWLQAEQELLDRGAQRTLEPARRTIARRPRRTIADEPDRP